MEERDMVGGFVFGSPAVEERWYAIKAVAMVSVRMKERSVSENGM